MLAELASRIPLAGYSYQWGGRLVGPGYGWFVGFNLLCAFTLASGGETLLLLSPTIGTVLGLNVDNKALMIISRSSSCCWPAWSTWSGSG